jgi:hypothetical protein
LTLAIIVRHEVLFWWILAIFQTHWQQRGSSYESIIQNVLGKIIELLLLTTFPDGRKQHVRRLSTRVDNSCIDLSKAYSAFFAEMSLGIGRSAS